MQQFSPGLTPQGNGQRALTFSTCGNFHPFHAKYQVLFDIVDSIGLAEQSAESRLNFMRVLIIDDDPVVQHILSAMVNGYAPQFLPQGDSEVKVSIAKNGREGVAALESPPLPEVIFLDLQLLDMTGLEVISELEAKLSTNIPPIITMSAQPITELRSQYPERNWDLFLQKPFLPDQVVEAIKKAAVPA